MHISKYIMKGIYRTFWSKTRRWRWSWSQKRNVGTPPRLPSESVLDNFIILWMVKIHLHQLVGVVEHSLRFWGHSSMEGCRFTTTSQRLVSLLAKREVGILRGSLGPPNTPSEGLLEPLSALRHQVHGPLWVHLHQRHHRPAQGSGSGTRRLDKTGHLLVQGARGCVDFYTPRGLFLFKLFSSCVFFFVFRWVLRDDFDGGMMVVIILPRDPRKAMRQKRGGLSK